MEDFRYYPPIYRGVPVLIVTAEALEEMGVLNPHSSVAWSEEENRFYMTQKMWNRIALEWEEKAST